MKNIFLIASILISSIAFSQHPFLKHKLTFGTEPRQIALADLDEDNDLDLVAAYGEDRVLAYYKNDGTGYFDSFVIISEMSDSVSAHVSVADLDNDGKVDLVTSSEDSIFWYKNLGNGNFSTLLMIDDSSYRYPRIYTADLDGDGLVEVFFTSRGDDKVGFYKNLGNGGFGTKQILNHNADGTRSAWAADLDNDSLTDVLSASYYDNKVVWHKNLGNGTFGSEIIISNAAVGPTFTLAADLNNDSLPDVVYRNDSTIASKRNLGNGNFSQEAIICNDTWGPTYVVPIDLDQDNDTDLVVPIVTMGEFFWLENLGGGIFGPKQMISNSIEGPYGLGAGDINGDGAHDLVVSGWWENKISVFHNREGNSFNLKQTLSNATVKVRSVYADDLNNDGLADIISASEDDDKIAWFENLGNKKFSVQKIINDSLDGAACSVTADLDNDGHSDIISGALDDSLVWQKNLGNGEFGSPQIISNHTSCTIIKTNDFNNDGWIDIMAKFGIGGMPMVYWFENLGNGEFGNGNFILGLGGLMDLCISDINNDGYNDLVFCSSSTLGYSFNDGVGNFPLIQYITGVFGAGAIDVKDMDQDGFKDIIGGGSTSSSSIYFAKWYPNDGTGNFNTEILIDTIPDYVYTTFGADMNNDSLDDIVVASHHELHWVENLGSGNFGTVQDIDNSGGTIHSICPGELDNDGDIDIVLCNFSGGEVLWYENTLNNLVDTQTICTGDSAFIFGSWQSQPGDYMDTLQNAQGNDSVIIVRLEHYQSYFPLDTIEICAGEPFWFDGQLLDSSGFYSATLQSVHGCDSLVEFPLIVIPAPSVSMSPYNPDSVSIDAGSIALPLVYPSGGNFSGTGVIANGFDPALAGLGEFWTTYTVVDTATGCASSDSARIRVYDPIGIDEIENSKIKLYPNPGTGDFVLSGTNLQSVHVKTLAGELVKEVAITNRNEVRFNLKELARGTYLVQIVNGGVEIKRMLVLM